jgi:hypothetical protein
MIFPTPKTLASASPIATIALNKILNTPTSMSTGIRNAARIASSTPSRSSNTTTTAIIATMRAGIPPSAAPTLPAIAPRVASNAVTLVVRTTMIAVNIPTIAVILISPDIRSPTNPRNVSIAPVIPPTASDISPKNPAVRESISFAFISSKN